VVRSEVAFRLEDPGLMSTGIAVDPETGDTYIASVRERKIVRRTKEGVTSDWIAPAQDGFLAGASLAFDATRRLLYASTATAPFMLGHSAADEGKSAVFVFAVQSGKLVRRVFLPPDGKPHFLNALLLERGGDVYVSDSATSGIYRLGRDASELETFVAPGVFASTQGLAFSDDEKTMYIADYSSGVWAMDVATKIRRKVATPAGEWLGGLDGLTRLSDGFLAVQVGVRPERVLRLRMDRQWQRIDAVEILEMNHPDYAGPVQGVLAGDAFLYIANSQLPLANAPEKAKPTTVLRLPV
jgi:sugar lactone lactonase YvrE